MFLLLVAGGGDLSCCSATCTRRWCSAASIWSSSRDHAWCRSGKAERALEALRDLSSPRALVVRDGRPARIAGAEVVRGDLVIARPKATGCRPTRGSRAANELEIDESLLTGESLPRAKGRSSHGLRRHAGR